MTSIQLWSTPSCLSVSLSLRMCNRQLKFLSQLFQVSRMKMKTHTLTRSWSWFSWQLYRTIGCHIDVDDLQVENLFLYFSFSHIPSKTSVFTRLASFSIDTRRLKESPPFSRLSLPLMLKETMCTDTLTSRLNSFLNLKMYTTRDIFLCPPNRYLCARNPLCYCCNDRITSCWHNTVCLSLFSSLIRILFSSQNLNLLFEKIELDIYRENLFFACFCSASGAGEVRHHQMWPKQVHRMKTIGHFWWRDDEWCSTWLLGRERTFSYRQWKRCPFVIDCRKVVCPINV